MGDVMGDGVMGGGVMGDIMAPGMLAPGQRWDVNPRQHWSLSEMNYAVGRYAAYIPLLPPQHLLPMLPLTLTRAITPALPLPTPSPSLTPA